MDKGSWSKQNLGQGTAHRISKSNTEYEISTETGANFLFLYKRSSKSMRKAVYIHAEKIRIPKKQINFNVHRWSERLHSARMRRTRCSLTCWVARTRRIRRGTRCWCSTGSSSCSCSRPTSAPTPPRKTTIACPRSTSECGPCTATVVPDITG